MVLQKPGPTPAQDPAQSPERWRTDAGDATEAVLIIPPDARRDRRFEIACAFSVCCPADIAGTWLEMTVLANGAQQWRRRIDVSNAGNCDGLDYRFARTVPEGEALKLVIKTSVRGVMRRQLGIEAEEI